MAIAALPPNPLRRSLQDKLREENSRLRGEIHRLREIQSATFTALQNPHLTVSEKVDALFTLFDIYYAEPAENGFRPVCIRAVAGRNNRSEDAVSKSIRHLAGFGLWQRKELHTWDQSTLRPLTQIVLRTPVDDLLADVRRLAALAPTEEERRAVTGRGRPGAAKGEKRARLIRPVCPDCHSESTSLVCRSCGTMTDTADLPDEFPDPQRTVQETVSQGPVTYGAGEHRGVGE